MNKNCIFSSESMGEGHPDKVSDRVFITDYLTTQSVDIAQGVDARGAEGTGTAAGHSVAKTRRRWTAARLTWAVTWERVDKVNALKKAMRHAA